MDTDQIRLVDNAGANPHNYRVVSGYDFDSCRPEQAPFLNSDDES